MDIGDSGITSCRSNRQNDGAVLLLHDLCYIRYGNGLSVHGCDKSFVSLLQSVGELTSYFQSTYIFRLCGERISVVQNTSRSCRTGRIIGRITGYYTNAVCVIHIRIAHLQLEIAHCHGVHILRILRTQTGDIQCIDTETGLIIQDRIGIQFKGCCKFEVLGIRVDSGVVNLKTFLGIRDLTVLIASQRHQDVAGAVCHVCNRILGNRIQLGITLYCYFCSVHPDLTGGCGTDIIHVPLLNRSSHSDLTAGNRISGLGIICHNLYGVGLALGKSRKGDITVGIACADCGEIRIILSLDHYGATVVRRNVIPVHIDRTVAQIVQPGDGRCCRRKHIIRKLCDIASLIGTFLSGNDHLKGEVSVGLGFEVHGTRCRYCRTGNLKTVLIHEYTAAVCAVIAEFSAKCNSQAAVFKTFYIIDHGNVNLIPCLPRGLAFLHLDTEQIDCRVGGVQVIGSCFKIYCS